MGLTIACIGDLHRNKETLMKKIQEVFPDEKKEEIKINQHMNLESDSETNNLNNKENIIMNQQMSFEQYKTHHAPILQETPTGKDVLLQVITKEPFTITELKEKCLTKEIPLSPSSIYHTLKTMQVNKEVVRIGVRESGYKDKFVAVTHPLAEKKTAPILVKRRLVRNHLSKKKSERGSYFLKIINKHPNGISPAAVRKIFINKLAGELKRNDVYGYAYYYTKSGKIQNKNGMYYPINVKNSISTPKISIVSKDERTFIDNLITSFSGIGKYLEGFKTREADLKNREFIIDKKMEELKKLKSAILGIA